MAKMQQEFLAAGTYKFQLKSCEDQFKFNSKVTGKFKEVDSELDKGSLAGAKEKISEGIELIEHRQKLVRLADSSELGWKLVEEYVSHPLADGSDDEKRINRAFTAANRKVKAEKKKRKDRFRPYSPPAAAAAPGPQGKARPGVCYNCHKPGHWAFECLEKKSTEKAKLSTSFSDLNCRIESIEHSGPDCDRSQRISEGQVCNTGKSLLGSCKSPVGRLKAAVDKWKSSGTSSYILSVINNGYGLPLKKVPLEADIKNNKSALDAKVFVGEEITKLLELKCISEVSRNQVHVINPLTVAQNRSGKQRLVLDCRYINPLLHTFKCKYEETSVARQIFQKGDHLFKFDLKSVYHHVMILEEHRKYLGFKWHFEGLTKYFVFNVLPFGLSTAGFIFTKLMREVLRHWREDGYKIILYLDDGLGGDSSVESSLKASEYIHSSLQDFGFLISEDKCQWFPSQHITWLGYVWDTVSGLLHVSAERVDRLVGMLNDLLHEIAFQRRLFKVRRIACIAGQIISMQIVLGAIVRLKTREMYKCIDFRVNWDSLIPLTNEAVSELDFWRHMLSTFNLEGRGIRELQVCSLVAFSDASGTGYGGYVESVTVPASQVTHCNEVIETCIDIENVAILDCEGGKTGIAKPNVLKTVTGQWTCGDSVRSSTWRELECVYRVMEECAQVMQGQNIEWHTDCKNVISVIKNGSRKADLQLIALKIFEFCHAYNVSILPKWIPRKENETADFLSRCFDCDDWSVNDDIFTNLDKIWGPHTIDRFSSNSNAKCIRFNSKFWCMGTEAVDCFSQCWKGEVNWLVPPPSVIPKVVNKIISEKADCTLVVPVWKASPFWPLLLQDGKFAEFCKDHIFLIKGKNSVAGKASSGIFGNVKHTVKFVALKIRF